MKRMSKFIMDIISKFSRREGLDEDKVRQEIQKAVEGSPVLRGISDAEFAVETVAYMILKQIHGIKAKNSRRVRPGADKAEV